MGFEVSTMKQTFNLKGDVRGESREWFFANTASEWTKSICHQATDCDMLHSTHSKAQKFCYKCAVIRHNSFYFMLQQHDQGTSASKKKFKRESYMNQDERAEKFEQEKVLRRKAEKRTFLQSPSIVGCP